MKLDEVRLGVNIDHVATVRNARGTTYPDPVKAALIARNSAFSLEVPNGTSAVCTSADPLYEHSYTICHHSRPTAEQARRPPRVLSDATVDTAST